MDLPGRFPRPTQKIAHVAVVDGREWKSARVMEWEDFFCSNAAIAAPGAGKKKKKKVKNTSENHMPHLSNFMLTLLHVKEGHDT